jgi:CheY-like chemotaxis protein
MTTIAVVEDNADNRLLLQALLADRFDLVEYDNGVDALAGLCASLPDLVLLDISLPGMDGNEILTRIRADPALAKLPVIALTAHAMSGDRERYLAAGFNDYITKPIVDESILLSAIARWLSDPRTGGA